VDRDSSVGIATRYGLDGPGIESRWGARFSAPFHTGPGAYPASYTMGTGFSPGAKRPAHGVDHSTPSKADVKERVELYVYSPSGPSWSVLGRALPLRLRFISIILGSPCAQLLADSPCGSPEMRQFVDKPVNLHGNKNIFARSFTSTEM
jgi:hypothetical protein